MARILAIVLLLAQAGTTKTMSATDVKAGDIQATVKQEIATNVTDIPIRTVDAGGHNVSVAVVHRAKGTNLTGMASHDKVSEVYSVTEGSGTFVTGGSLISPQKREASSDTVKGTYSLLPGACSRSSRSHVSESSLGAACPATAASTSLVIA